MDGDFKGDFTRDTFDPLQRFSRVLMQQGRVQLDADWNEQTDLFLYALRTLITGLVGPHWGTFDFDVDPQANNGSGGVKPNGFTPNSFKIEQLKDPSGRVTPLDFLFREGHYYVDGLLCENPVPTAYMSQQPEPKPLEDHQYWVYLDVWERQITFLEDRDIREVALGENGPDTATRAEVVWQVKTSTVPTIPGNIDSFGQGGQNADKPFLRIKLVEDSTQYLTGIFQHPFRGELKARGKAPPNGDIDLCITPPDSQFRGDENQLYRVEIHTGGFQETATFKWSRENGSVVFPIVSLAGNTVTLENLGRDSHLSLQEGDWVEIVDDDYILQVATLQGPGSITPPHGSINPLLQIDKVDPMNVQVTLKSSLSGAPFPNVGQDQKKHPLLRRWDQKNGTGKKGGKPKLLSDGTIQIKEGTTDGYWLTLEDGVQVQFQPGGITASPPTDMIYRTGDYWLIPARTIIGDVLWPQENDPSGTPYLSGHPKALPPHGVKHHYALLAVVSFSGNDVTVMADLRYMVPPLGKLAVFLDIAVFGPAGL